MGESAASVAASGLIKPSALGMMASGSFRPGTGPTSHSRIQGGLRIRIYLNIKARWSLVKTGYP